MIQYTIYNTSNGKILSTGTAQDKNDVEKQLDTTSSILWMGAYSNQYVENNTLITMPSKPEGEYIFDYSTKKWVFDYNSAVSKVLAERDRLLAEGPDRISPMWWASMTEQEQQAWTFYRQALLDITEQADYPEFIVWPIKP